MKRFLIRQKTKHFNYRNQRANGAYGNKRGLKVAIVWSMAPCSQYMNQRFGGMYHFYLQGKEMSRTRN
jgi:hypothetical protein